MKNILVELLRLVLQGRRRKRNPFARRRKRDRLLDFGLSRLEKRLTKASRKRGWR